MNSALPVFTQLTSDLHVESCKAAIFQIADYWLALPATAILKVIPSSELTSVGIGDKLSRWNECPLVWLDLHELLSRSSAVDSQTREHPLSNSSNYVLIVWSPTGDRCAIPVNKLPMLLEIPLSKVQVLPPHYRHTISSIARHVVTLSHQGTVLTVLLLDLQQALTLKHFKS